MNLSVIIPTRNEQDALPKLIRDLRNQTDISLEIIVADGESTDNTVTLAQSLDCKVVESSPGRAIQMNSGAAIASGSWLLFLHADSGLPTPLILSRAMASVQAESSYRLAGHFPLIFVCEQTDKRRAAWRYLEAKTTLNRANTINGDQGFLISTRFFSELGGFESELPFMEDQNLAEKIHQHGRWIALPDRIETSGRRFETEGFHRRYFLMTLMMTAREIGLGEFFQAAPSLYREQQQVSKLRLAPFITLLWRLSGKQGWKGRWLLACRAGRFGLENVWQIFLWLDVQLHRESANQRPCLGFHDSKFQPFALRPTVSAVMERGIALFCLCWVFGLMWPWFAMTERLSVAGRAEKP